MSGAFDGCSFDLIQSRPVVSVCAHVWSLPRSARLLGAVALVDTSTPWLALKYGVVKSTVRLRWVVIVASWKERSKSFVPGANSFVHGDRTQMGLRPRPVAIADATSTS